MLVWDVVRTINLFLFLAAVFETTWILRKYFQIWTSTRRLLPMHVTLISIAVLGLEAEAAFQNFDRYGEGFTWYQPLNSVLFSLTYVSLLMIRLHVTRKVNRQHEISPLTQDPREVE